MTVLNVQNVSYLWNGIPFRGEWVNHTVIVRHVDMSLIHRNRCQNRSGPCEGVAIFHRRPALMARVAIVLGALCGFGKSE